MWWVTYQPSVERICRRIWKLYRTGLWFITTPLSLSLFLVLKKDGDQLLSLSMFVSCEQPDVSVYHSWSPCRDNWIHRVDWFCVLLCGDVDYICWTHGQGRILCWLVLWFMESSSLWRLSWWPHGMPSFSFLSLVLIRAFYQHVKLILITVLFNLSFCSRSCCSGRILLLSISGGVFMKMWKRWSLVWLALWIGIV